MSLHEINLYIGLLVACMFLIFGTFKKEIRFLWIFSLFIGIIFIINYQLSASIRLTLDGAFPLAEVVTKRILPNNEFVDFFDKRGDASKSRVDGIKW